VNRRVLTSRREVLSGLAAGLLAGSARAAPENNAAEALALLEQQSGGRIGLAALDGGSGARLERRSDERFAMCSTFKLMLAAALLARADAGSADLKKAIAYTRAELLPNSPVTQAHASAGALPLATLLQAVVEVSDNTAANLLLAQIGGPAGYTQYLRSLGDSSTRLDRNELTLNSNLPGDPRDTTTPAAMLQNLRSVLTGNALSSPAREQLLGWMRSCRTGRDRLRAYIPAGWRAGDKTGTGDNGAVNDLAIFWPPRRAPILVACYLSGSTRTTQQLSGVQARIGAVVSSEFSRHAR
jgi:beta-lactamase class A